MRKVDWLIDWNRVLSRFNSISVISRLRRQVARSTPHLHRDKNMRYWSRNLNPDQNTRVTDILDLNLSRTWTDVQIHHFMMPLSISQSPKGYSLLAAFYCIMPGYGSGSHSFCQLTKPGPLYQVYLPWPSWHAPEPHGAWHNMNIIL